METGHLNIPIAELDKVTFVQDIETRMYLLYSKIIEDNEYGKRILQALEDDERVKCLNDCMISNGSGASRFEIKKLAMWHLWAINEYGQECAEKNLNKFLNEDTINLVNTLWVLGIKTDKTYKFKKGFSIVPIHEMPNSRDKEVYLRNNYYQIHRLPNPEAAITYTCSIPKVWKNESNNNQISTEQYWETSELLNEVGLLLNSLDGISCIPYYSTSYTLPDMPMGMFGASGGGAPLHDIIGFNLSSIPESSISMIDGLVDAYSKKNIKIKHN